jgi:hypothetical protein
MSSGILNTPIGARAAQLVEAFVRSMFFLNLFLQKEGAQIWVVMIGQTLNIGSMKILPQAISPVNSESLLNNDTVNIPLDHSQNAKADGGSIPHRLGIFLAELPGRVLHLVTHGRADAQVDLYIELMSRLRRSRHVQESSARRRPAKGLLARRCVYLTHSMISSFALPRCSLTWGFA